MRAVRLLVVASMIVVVGCFGRQATVSAPSAPEGKGGIQASPVATQEIITVSPTPGAPPSTTSASSPSAPVVAQDSGMAVSDIRVGDVDLSGSVRFTVQGAGKITVNEQFTSPRLFRVDDRGRSILVSNTTITALGDAVGVTIPASGSYLVAGEELPFSIEGEPLAFRTRAGQNYRIQQKCESQPWVEGPAGVKFYVYATTRDTSFPSPVDVYIHHAAGGEDRPDAYSFQALIDDVQPEGVTLNYIRDTWDTRLVPDVAAQLYDQRWECDPGRSRLDICHSAGCLKALIAMVMAHRARDHDWNHLGIVAASPAFGGSHVQIKEMFDAWISIRDKPRHFGALFFLAQRDIGYLAIPERAEFRFLKHFLTGNSLTLYNELGRTLAWNGLGTGIPTVTYGWFSEHNFGIPYLQKRLTPKARFLTLKENALAEYAPETYLNYNAGGGEYFNYIEALDQYYIAMKGYWSGGLGEQRLAKKVDVIVPYIGNDTSKEARVFEGKYGANELLNNLWALLDPSSQYRLDFEKAAMPWLHEYIGEAPSVAAQPNENALNDGALTVAQQLGLRDGSSILVKSSDSVSVDEDVVRSRLPEYIHEFQTFPGRDHIDAGITDSAIRSQIRDWILRRTKHLKEEETAYVLTSEDKNVMRNTFFPEPMPVVRFDYTGQFRDDYWFSGQGGLTFTQDPLGVGQKNRVRMAGSGEVSIWRHERKDGVGYVLNRIDEEFWDIQMRDFIRRNGVWHLVVN